MMNRRFSLTAILAAVLVVVASVVGAHHQQATLTANQDAQNKMRLATIKMNQCQKDGAAFYPGSLGGCEDLAKLDNVKIPCKAQTDATVNELIRKCVAGTYAF
jgi:hypothetical protein